MRLIDADALMEKFGDVSLMLRMDGFLDSVGEAEIVSMIGNAPTIEPAIEPEIEQEKERTPNENCPKCKHWEVFVREECEWNYHCEFEPIEPYKRNKDE